MTEPRILLLPGWQNSGPGHWQTRWESVHGDHRVEQHEWMRPLRGDWSARLEEEVLASPGQVVFAAHSLGCILVAAWAARFIDAGAGGHLNAESGLGDWPEGRKLLNEISKEKN